MDQAPENATPAPMPPAAEAVPPPRAAEEPPPDATEEPAQALVHVPLHVRSVTLVVLTTLAMLATLKWASAFFIPLMLGLIFSYALSPIVDALERFRIPRALSAAVLIVGILGGAVAS